MKIYEVEWKDVHYDYEVEKLVDLKPCVYVITVGVLVAEVEGSWVLAQDWYSDGTFRSFTSIPREFIVRKRLLGSIKPKHKFKASPKGMEEV